MKIIDNNTIFNVVILGKSFNVSNIQELVEIVKEHEDLKKENKQLKEALEFEKTRTYLIDRTDKEICSGNIVCWSDGGEELPMEKRISTRWDRIAIVLKNPQIQFKVMDSPAEPVKLAQHTYEWGSFLYKNTKKYLTIVAKNQQEYHELFKSAGDCMKWVEKILKAKE